MSGLAVITRTKHLLELIRFSHTVFAIPFALLSAALAWESRTEPFRWRELLGIVACMVFARSAAMAFNRIADRDSDSRNPRTTDRHLPAGLLTVPFVAGFTLVCSVGFVASTVLFLPNRLPLLLSIPVLLFLLGYSYAKRWTSLCHYWLSAALAFSPVAAWIAVRGNIQAAPLLLAGMVFFWVGGFDLIYACQDADFDRRNGLHSIPARFGIARALRLAAISHLFAVVSLFGFWWTSGLGIVLLVGVVVVALLLAYEHSLVRPDDLSRVNLAFFNVNAIISLGLLAVGLVDLWLLPPG